MQYQSAAKTQQESVDDAYRLLGTRKHGVGCFPTFLLICLENRVWESEREDASGKPVAPCSFYDFIHKPYPSGLDSSYEAIEPIIGSEPQLVAAWQKISGRSIDNAPMALPLASIRADGGTQSRAAIDESVVAEYQDHLKSLPPVVVFYDGSDYWLADGFHRLEAHKRASLESIIAEIRQGTLRDAVLFSVGANAAHGLRRTNADKRRAVELLLGDEEWKLKSDRWVANRCGVGHQLVASIRNQVGDSSTCRDHASTRLGQDGKAYPSSQPTSRKLPERRQQPAETASTALEPVAEPLPALVESPAPEPSCAPVDPPRLRQMTIEERIEASARQAPSERAPEPASEPQLAEVHHLEGLAFSAACRAVERLSDLEWQALVELESERRANETSGGMP